MNELIIPPNKFYMSGYRALDWAKVMESHGNVEVITCDMTDEFGILFENEKISIVYFDQSEE